MEFRLQLANQQKAKWLLLYIVGWAGSAGVAGVELSELGSRICSFVSAGAMAIGLAVFVAAYLLFERVQAATREPICITVLPSQLLETNETTQATRSWPLSQLLSCRYQAGARGGPYLMLTFQNGEKMK